jgi:hypothetical protein
MAVEIRELIIKAIVSDQPSNASKGVGPSIANGYGASNTELAVQVSIEKVLEIIRNKNDR